jgi:hypothetical protein
MKFTKYFDAESGGFIYATLSTLILFIILMLCWSIFGPLMNNVFGGLVDQYAYGNSRLLSAKTLVLTFFNFFPYAFSGFLLCFQILSSLKRENDSYRQ